MFWQLKDNYTSLLKDEIGTTHKTRGGKLTVGLIYPNLYGLGMSNLGFQKVYALFNREENILCERIFLPPPDEIKVFQKNRLPLFSLESQTPVNKFDLLAFSVSFETDYLHILEILSIAKIPYLSGKRTDNDPLIIAGGICPSFNPAPLTDFVDLFMLGEGEELIPEFIQKYLKFADQTKKNKLEQLSLITGVYVPSIHVQPGNKIKQRFLKSLDAFPTRSQIITSQTTFANCFLIETGRGCARQCSFCLSGHLYPPNRFYSLSVIMDQIKQGMKLTKKIGLIGSALGDHPELDSLCQELEKLNLEVSVSSLRLDAPFEPLIRLLGKTGCKTIALAPEAGSHRLRKLINKDIPQEKILEAVAMAISYDILNLKFYFLIGLPREEEADIIAISELVLKIREVMIKQAKKNKRLGKIILAINPFIPKPFTPFERMGMEEVGLLQKKIKIIKHSLKNTSNLKIICESPRESFIQAMLSRGDQRMGKTITAAYNLGGDWHQAIKESDWDIPAFVYGTRTKAEPLPWDFISQNS